MLAYGRKVCGLTKGLKGVTDSRPRPEIPTLRIVKAVVVMFLTRMGSLNALEQSRSSGFWFSWLRGPMPSADSLGRVCAQADLGTLREAIAQVYSRLKRAKALPPPRHGLMALVLDAHESHATYRRRCAGCLERVVSTKQGEKTQFYHRHVTAHLVAGQFGILLDAEPQRPGEDEVAAAIRLAERVYQRYPRAFDVVCGDALYTDPRFYGWARNHGKDVVTVLKDDRRDLLQDAQALLDVVEPVESWKGKTRRLCWDLEGLTSWPQAGGPVRVVRSLETTAVKRQLTNEVEEAVSSWFWCTTLSTHRAGVQAVVDLGHARWDIENRGFNETTTRWAADHVFKHDPIAMTAFWLLCMIAYNVFHAFYWRNLKPAFRVGVSMLHVARMLASTIYSKLPQQVWVPP